MSKDSLDGELGNFRDWWCKQKFSNWISLSVLTAIFQANLGSPVFIEAKDDGSGGDYWSYKSCKAPVKSSPPTNQYPVFYRPDALFVAEPTVSKHWREKYHIPWTSSSQAHLGSSNFVSDQWWLLVTLGRVAMLLISSLCQYPQICQLTESQICMLQFL